MLSLGGRSISSYVRPWPPPVWVGTQFPFVPVMVTAAPNGQRIGCPDGDAHFKTMYLPQSLSKCTLKTHTLGCISITYQ